MPAQSPCPAVAPTPEPDSSSPASKPASPGAWVVVLLVIHNRLALTQRCVSALAASTGRLRLTLVIVDDGSTDGTAEWLRNQHGEIHVVPGDGSLWFGGGMDAGLRYIRRELPTADYLLLLNNDTFVYPDCLQTMIAASRGERSVAGALWISDRGITGTSGFRWRHWRGMEDVCLSSDWRAVHARHALEFLPTDAVATTLALHPMARVRCLRMVDPAWHPQNRYDAVLSARLRAQGALFVTASTALAEHLYGNISARPSLRRSSWREIGRAVWRDRRSVHHLGGNMRMLWEIAPSRLHALPVMLRHLLLLLRTVAGRLVSPGGATGP